MSRYQHTKGQIKDNAIEALLHDPLFRQRVEKNKKRERQLHAKKENMAIGGTGRPDGKKVKLLLYHWPSAFRRLLRAVILLFQQITNFCQ